MRREPTIPLLAVTLGLTSFAYGAIIGVLIQIQLASGTNLFPGGADAIGAHAGTMVFSYLILVAMGLLEWRTVGLRRRSRTGQVQIGALFGGGLLLALTLLFLDQSAVQAVGGIYLLVELVAVALFTGRVVRHAVRIDWRAASPERHLATSAAFVVVATAIFLYVVFLFISTGDPSKIPAGVLVASDHAAFIGVITNLIFGLALRLAADRRDRWPWADQVVFWAMNGGLVVFLVGLIAVSPELKRIGSPIMGIAILLGLATIAVRLWSSDLREADTVDEIAVCLTAIAATARRAVSRRPRPRCIAPAARAASRISPCSAGDGRDGLAEDPQGGRHLGGADGQGGRHPDGLPAALQDEQPAHEAGPLDLLGVLGRVELDPDHQPLAADVDDQPRVPDGEPAKTGERLLAAGRGVLDEPALEEVDRGQRRRAGDRVAAVGRAVGAGAPRLEDRRLRDERGERSSRWRSPWP